MSGKTIIAIMGICAVVTGLFLGNMFSLLMIAELDRKREDSSLDSSFAFTRRASFRTFREYRNLCPGGKLHIYSLAGYALAMIGLFGLAVCMVTAYQPLVVRITFSAGGAMFTSPAGSYSLTAKAIDDRKTTTADAVSITVNAPRNTDP